MSTVPDQPGAAVGQKIRLRGTVQGVGMRPTIWRLAQAAGLSGQVHNDADGVLIRVWGPLEVLDALVAELQTTAPPLARIESIERSVLSGPVPAGGFRIVDSLSDDAHTPVTADAATCSECRSEIFDPFARRYRYPLSNCTHCGPRLSILRDVPWDRARTTMAGFEMCDDCRAEYLDPTDRRFHAQPIACHACGPQLRLERTDQRALAVDTLTTLDAVDAVCTVLQRGHILAIQGLGGFQLACDAGNALAVDQLRASKGRKRKPLALMARDLSVIEAYCKVSSTERQLLESPAAPIVLLDRHSTDCGPRLAEGIAPGLNNLGFMLPNTPMHHLMLKRMDRPIVLTSGNLADQPQLTELSQVRDKLADIAEFVLHHDRPIARRVDDSVVRVMAGEPRILRRARGYAPAPLPLPLGFEAAPPVLALGGELKNCFALTRDGQLTLSMHIGDLQNAETRADYRRGLDEFTRFFNFHPAAYGCDRHPQYASSVIAAELAERHSLPLLPSQHHHAHIAACMAENGLPRQHPPVLGIALDGLGYGDDGFWGGEFLLASYTEYQRLGTFKPVALPGGNRAMLEPWRNTYAHIQAGMGWAAFRMNYHELELYRFLEQQPRETMDSMITRGTNSPLASSCGRLFDAVSAAIGVVRHASLYEGQAASELEAVIDHDCLNNETRELDYPFAIPRLGGSGLPYIEPLAMWQALLGDLLLNTPAAIISARFHRGLASAVTRMASQLARNAASDPIHRIALSGGVFQNRTLFELTRRGLQQAGFEVLTHRDIPANDAGLAAGQAVIAAAQLLERG